MARKYLLTAALLGGLTFGTGAPALACDAPSRQVVPLLNTATIPNLTGQTANDLHVNLNDVETQPLVVPPTPTAPPFKTVNPDSVLRTIDFSGEQVAAGKSVQVTWQSISRGGDGIEFGSWTHDGMALGTFGEQPVTSTLVSFSNDSLGIGLDNLTGAPLPYTNLEAFRKAPGQFFTPQRYLIGLEELGTRFQLLVPASGVLDPGITLIAEVPNRDPPASYDGAMIEINGKLFAGAALETPVNPVATVPEPGMLSLVLTALPLLGVLLFGRHARKRRGLTS